MEKLVHVDMTKLNMETFLDKYPSSEPNCIVRFIARYIFRFNRHQINKEAFGMNLMSKKNSIDNKFGPVINKWMGGGIKSMVVLFVMLPMILSIIGIILYCYKCWKTLRYLALVNSSLYLLSNLALYLFVCIIIQVKIYSFNFALYKLIESGNKQPHSEDPNEDPFSTKSLQNVKNA